MTNSTSALTGLTWVPVGGAIGAEVRGVDLSEIDSVRWDQLHALWLDHLVLFFPDQSITPDQHVELGRRLGEVEIHPFLEKLDKDHPEVVVLDSDAGIRADTWHSDVTFTSTPPMASIFHMVIAPPAGGDTMFSNQYLAYERLSEPIRELVDGLSAVHSAAIYGHPEITTIHPVVRTHPETGRRSLFVNRTFTTQIAETNPTESDSLLEMLFRWSEQAEFQCRYRWAPGTIGIWDNRCTQHYGVNDYRGTRRIHRVTVLGDQPFGGVNRWKPWLDSSHSARNIGRNITTWETDSRTNSIHDAT